MDSVCKTFLNSAIKTLSKTQLKTHLKSQSKTQKEPYIVRIETERQHLKNATVFVQDNLKEILRFSASLCRNQNK